jgi:hypothetical protein
MKVKICVLSSLIFFLSSCGNNKGGLSKVENHSQGCEHRRDNCYVHDGYNFAWCASDYGNVNYFSTGKAEAACKAHAAGKICRKFYPIICEVQF